MKIKVTSLVDAQLNLKSSKGEAKSIAGKKSVTMSEAEFSFFKGQCEVFEKSGKLKIEEVKGKAEPKAEPKPEPVVEESAEESAEEKPAKVAKKASKKVSKKAQGRSKKRTRKS